MHGELEGTDMDAGSVIGVLRCKEGRGSGGQWWRGGGWKRCWGLVPGLNGRAAETLNVLGPKEF